MIEKFYSTMKENLSKIDKVEKSEVAKESLDNENMAAYVETRNQALEGQEHPISGISFVRSEVELASGEIVEGVFPEFPYSFEAQLGEHQHLSSDAVHFREANGQLREAIQSSEVGEVFSKEQLVQIEAGDTPDGYVWHHAEEPGALQLVERTLHDQTGHTGGRFLWGGGSDFR